MKSTSRRDHIKILKVLALCILCSFSFHAHADTETPTTRITSDLSNLFGGSLTISGIASDSGGSGVDRVFVSIRNNAGLFFYDGAFRREDTTTFRHLNVASGTERWSITLALPAGTYELTARSRDVARNQDPQVRDRRTIVVQARTTAALSSATTPGSSSPFVQGNSLVFPDDGYYQVQTADGSRNICEGRRSCDVANGSYLVINHTSGARFNNVLVGGGGSVPASPGSTGSSPSSASGIAISGNTISFSDNDYYQVQTADGSRNICEGQRSCEAADGEYLVINHSSGERFNNIVIGGGASGSVAATPAAAPVESVITVTGNTISWPDNGYYQVQTADGSRTVCEGGRSCPSVSPPGEYLVINHTTGERLQAIVGQGNSSTPAPSPLLRIEDAPLLIRAATLSDFLMDEVVLVRFAASAGGLMLAGVPNPFTSIRLPQAVSFTPDVTLSDGTVFSVGGRASCPEGGTVFDGFSETFPASAPTVPGTASNLRRDLFFDQCGVDGLELNGLSSQRFGSFEGLDEFNDENGVDQDSLYIFQNFEVIDGDRVVTLESDRLVGRREVFDGVGLVAETADFLVEGTLQTYTVTDSTGGFSLRDVEISQSRLSGNNTTTSNFILETLNGQAVNAQGTIVEEFRISPDGQFLESGVLVVSDGNIRVTIEANDRTTYLVTLERDGTVMTAILPWSGTDLPVPALAIL